MEQLLMKIRGIVNNNKQQKHVAFYSEVYAYMYKPEKLDYDYSEMESTFMERKTPGGVKNTSAPGQYPPPSVRRTRRDDLDWDFQ
jgi:hypothetical protein